MSNTVKYFIGLLTVVFLVQSFMDFTQSNRKFIRETCAKFTWLQIVKLAWKPNCSFYAFILEFKQMIMNLLQTKHQTVNKHKLYVLCPPSFSGHSFPPITPCSLSCPVLLLVKKVKIQRIWTKHGVYIAQWYITSLLVLWLHPKCES